MTPVFFNFRMRLYSGFVLSECTCISAGLGVYPEASEPKPGIGPTKLEVLKELYEIRSMCVFNSISSKIRMYNEVMFLMIYFLITGLLKVKKMTIMNL